MESIYTYENYRRYLGDYYTEHKKTEPGFSWRLLAKKAGFGSPVFLKLVVDGSKNLGSYSIDRVAAALLLDKSESAYLHAMVAFTHADTDYDRNYHFMRMAQIRTRAGVAKINIDQFSYYSEWFIPIVREVISNKPSGIPLQDIASKVRPKITVRQTQHAIDVLLSTGLIMLVDGTYRQSSALIATDPDVKSLAVRNFHEQMLAHATTALRESTTDERSVSGLTLKISKKGFHSLASRIDEFREELLRIAAADNDVDRVYQVGIQLFPVSEDKL